MANRSKFTPQKKGKFLSTLRKWPNVSRAARICGISRQTAYDHANPNHASYDPAFAAEWEEAIEEGLDRHEEEMERRAYQGVLETIYYKGEMVGKVRRYSDTLAIFLAKAHRPEKFREHHSVELTGKDGKPLLDVGELAHELKDWIDRWEEDRRDSPSTGND